MSVYTVCGLRMCADSKCPFYRDYFAVLARLAGWLGGGGERGTRGDRRRPPWQLLWWRFGLPGRTAAAAGSGGSCWRSQECCSLAVSGVMLPTVPDLRRKKTGIERSGPTLTAAKFPPGHWQLGQREQHRRSTYCCPPAQLVRHWRTSLLRPASLKAQPVPRG